MLLTKYRPRIYYTEEQKVLMWDRWQKGEYLPIYQIRLKPGNHAV
jgi:hypothetical protein